VKIKLILARFKRRLTPIGSIANTPSLLALLVFIYKYYGGGFGSHSHVAGHVMPRANSPHIYSLALLLAS
jgi:hypothetical protein